MVSVFRGWCGQRGGEEAMDRRAEGCSHCGRVHPGGHLVGHLVPVALQLHVPRRSLAVPLGTLVIFIIIVIRVFVQHRSRGSQDWDVICLVGEEGAITTLLL